MIVGGNSGTGKTFMATKLKYNLELDTIELNSNTKKERLHVMLNPNELDVIDENITGNIFVIDRASMMDIGQKKKAQKLVMNSNIFILFTRYMTPISDGGPIFDCKLYTSKLDNGMRYFEIGLEDWADV